MNSVKIRLYASARSAAGFSEIDANPGTLSEILSGLSSANPLLQGVLLRCTFLIDGTTNHDFEIRVVAGSVIDILPPFAGG